MGKEMVLDMLEMIGGKVRQCYPNRRALDALRALEEELILDLGREEQSEAMRQIDTVGNGRAARAEKNRLPG